MFTTRNFVLNLYITGFTAVDTRMASMYTKQSIMISIPIQGAAHPMVTHIVFFKLADPTTANINTVRDKLLSMNGKILQLRHLETGIDVIRSERSYDVALVTKFDSLEDLQAYQVHPYHAGEVVPLMKSVCSSIAAVDYES